MLSQWTPLHEPRPEGDGYENCEQKEPQDCYTDQHQNPILPTRGKPILTLIPGKPGDPGRTGNDNRLFVDAIVWMARTGTPWRDLSPFFGKWNSVWKRFRRWAKAGVWERIMAALADDPDFESVIIDGTIIRAHQHAAGGKGGFKNRRSGDRAVA